MPDYDVIRCWRFDSLSNPVRLLRAIHDIKPDVVWFNLLFSTFGNKPVPAFFGLTQPVLSRLSGRYTHVTLHHLMDNIDLADSGVRFPRLYQRGRHGRDAHAADGEFHFGVVARLSPHADRKISWRERAFPRSRHSWRDVRSRPTSASAAILSIAFSPSASGEPTSDWSC